MSTSDRTLNSLVVHLVQLELLQTFQGGMISAFPKEQTLCSDSVVQLLRLPVEF